MLHAAQFQLLSFWHRPMPFQSEIRQRLDTFGILPHAPCSMRPKFVPLLSGTAPCLSNLESVGCRTRLESEIWNPSVARHVWNLSPHSTDPFPTCRLSAFRHSAGNSWSGSTWNSGSYPGQFKKELKGVFVTTGICLERLRKQKTPDGPGFFV